MTGGAQSRMMTNRAALISATRRNLVDQGLDGLGFERIAATAGMTRKSVYNHFSSRAGLYEALMDDIGQRADFRRLASVWDTDEPADLLQGFFSEIVRAWQADRVMFRMMIGLSAADPELGAAVQGRIGRVRGIAGQLAERLAVAPGLAPGWSLPEATATLFALASFNSFDAMATEIGVDATAMRLAALARAPFDWNG
jgi:AcrR family transcriptional regulator